MTALLDKSTLNEINRTLYPRGVKAVFYRLTPADGETPIATLTSGFMVNEGESVIMRLAADAGIDRSLLHVGAVVALTINGQTLKYSLVELLPFQQLGTGYALRLDPLQGATG